MSETYTLMVVNVAHIQDFIFGSNRLQENIGASYLVDAATGAWAWEAASQVSGLRLYRVSDNELYIADPAINIRNNSPAEVIYAGGGNFVVLFREDCVARAFVEKLSERALQDAPGLRLIMTSISYTWGDSLGDAIQFALRQLREARNQPSVSTPLDGLGITLMCASTAMPAVDLRSFGDGEPLRPISASIAAKLKAARQATGRLKTVFPLTGTVWEYPEDLDYLGRSRGDASFIAVVHADGNGMGSKIQEIGTKKYDPRKYIEEMRGFSEGLAAAASRAMFQTIMQLIRLGYKTNSIEHPRMDTLRVEFATNPKNGDMYLPFRPLVFGGDDVTFVCDGRLGISLAMHYLAAFERETRQQAIASKLGVIQSTARAGVAIVKSHYPFARAYQLAEELAASAKKARLNREIATLDWHFALSGLHGDLDTMRARELDILPSDSVVQHRLTLRPISINQPDTLRDWLTIQDGLEAFCGPEWAAKRNKQFDLREALRGGPKAVEQFRKIYRQTLPVLRSGVYPDGWETSHSRLGEPLCSVYWDALELADFYIPLVENSLQEAADAIHA